VRRGWSSAPRRAQAGAGMAVWRGAATHRRDDRLCEGSGSPPGGGLILRAGA